MDYNWSDLPNLGDFQWRVNFDTLQFYLYLYVIQHNKSRSVDQSYCCWGRYICTACGSGALLWTKFSLDRISSLHIWFEAVQRPSHYFGPVWSTGIGACLVHTCSRASSAVSSWRNLTYLLWKQNQHILHWLTRIFTSKLNYSKPACY